MATKHKGLCPFCKETVTPTIVEENIVRRDRCRCPQCGNDIYVCRNPACEDYAKGGSLYDEEFCPSCTASGFSLAKTLALPFVMGMVKKGKK